MDADRRHFWLLAVGFFSYLMVIFSGASFARAGKVINFIADLMLIVFPALTILSIVMIWQEQPFMFGYSVYWWLLLPLPFSIGYAVIWP